MDLAASAGMNLLSTSSFAVPKAPQGPLLPNEQKDGQTSKPKILIVDDDIALSRLVQLSLEKTRLYRTRLENHSTSALQAVREFRPDLILLDIDMPVLDGGEVARQIRADHSLRETPIVFFTSLLSQNEAGQGLVGRGGDHFLAKPIDTLVLIRSIESLLGSIESE